MHLIAVDDEQFALKDLIDTIMEVMPEANVQGFPTPAKALAYAKSADTPIDIAFLDIEMSGMNGLELAQQLKKYHGKTNIIFVTGYSEHALDAFALFASGYILKPVSAQAITDSLEHLRHPVETVDKGLRIQTFGNFEVFFDGQPLRFPRSKAKELLAYLIHKRGSGSTTKELAAILFEDKEYDRALQSHMQLIVSTMMKVLGEINMQDIIIREFNSLAVNTAKINCDYYRFFKWDTDAINSYTGEYMSNYSWAEFTAAYLDNQVF